MWRMSEGGESVGQQAMAVHTERDVPVQRIRDSFFDPATWADLHHGPGDTDMGSAMRRMQKQMVEMERQMERMFEQFHRMEPTSASRSRMTTGSRLPTSWWDDDGFDAFGGWRRGPRALWDGDLALPAPPVAAAPVSPIGEPPRMLRQTSREEALSRQTSREPGNIVPYQTPYEPDPTAKRVGQFGGPVVIDQGGNQRLRMRFDVRQFKPEEITVKTQDNKVMVRGLHKEESDSNQVYCEYQRMFTMPPDVKPETLESVLSADGVLTLEAPMPGAVEAPKDTVIPITHEKASNM